MQAAGNVRAYVPTILPLTRTEPQVPAGAGKVNAEVRLLVTVDEKGAVVAAEALGGPEIFRKPAIDAVKQWTYRPVRDGAAVTAYTDANVFFFGENSSVALPESMDDAAADRLAQIVEAFPRSEARIFADAEQDALGRSADERFSMPPELTIQALHAGADDKAKALARELMAALPNHASDPDYGDAFYNAHMALGLIALHGDDVAAATRELLESGRTSGSPLLDSFGPNLSLAYELLRKGESPGSHGFSQSRTFWKDGSPQIDEWIATIRRGSVPVFGANLR